MRPDDLWSFYPGIGRGAPGHKLPLSARKGEHVHFVFVEDVDVITNHRAIDAPDNTTISGRHRVFKNMAVRFRTSGPAAKPFLTAMSQFERLETGTATSAQRNARRQQLLAFFEEVAIPTIDIYVSKRDAEYRSIRQTLLPGSWSIAVFNDAKASAGIRPVIYGAPELPPDERVNYGTLRKLAPVAPPIELRLRDIFSLNHVRDAALPTGRGESGGGIPLAPLRPLPLSGLRVEEPQVPREQLSVKSKTSQPAKVEKFGIDEPEEQQRELEIEMRHAPQVHKVRIIGE